MAEQEEGSDSDRPIIDDNVIRIQLRKPSHRKWELRTRNFSPGIKFPTIQLFDCDGNLLIETNDENISIKSSSIDKSELKTSQSLKEKDIRHVISKDAIRKRNTISGDQIYTRVYKVPCKANENISNSTNGYIISNCNGTTNIPKQSLVVNHYPQSDTSLQPSDVYSEISSYKSSDNESSIEEFDKNSTKYDEEKIFESSADNDLINEEINTSNLNKLVSSLSCKQLTVNVNESIMDNNINDQSPPLQKSKSFNNYERDCVKIHNLPRSKSGLIYMPPQNKISFLNTYLKSLPGRTVSNPDWFALSRRNKSLLTQRPIIPTLKLRDTPKQIMHEKAWRFCRIWNNTSENDLLNVPTDVAAECEFKKRLKIYRRGVSEIEHRTTNLFARNRRHSISAISKCSNSSSSESVDEADVVLNRLRRRILKNKMRAKKPFKGTTLSSKWRNLRDNYTRDVRKNCIRVSNGDKRHHDYKHSKLLDFLYEQIMKKRISRFTAEEHQSSCSEDDPLVSSAQNSTVDTSHEHFIKEEMTLQPNLLTYGTNTCFEPQEIPSTSSMINPQDDDLAFYMSTLPIIRNLTTEKKIQYRVEVMNLVQKYYQS